MKICVVKERSTRVLPELLEASGLFGVSALELGQEESDMGGIWV